MTVILTSEEIIAQSDYITRMRQPKPKQKTKPRKPRKRKPIQPTPGFDTDQIIQEQHHSDYPLEWEMLGPETLQRLKTQYERNEPQ